MKAAKGRIAIGGFNHGQVVLFARGDALRFFDRLPNSGECHAGTDMKRTSERPTLITGGASSLPRCLVHYVYWAKGTEECFPLRAHAIQRRSSGSQAIGFVRVPIIAQTAVVRVVHLVTGVLCEFEVEIVIREPKNLFAGVDQLSRQLGSLLGGAAAADIAHQKRGRPWVFFSTAPDAPLTKLAYGDG